MPEGYTPCAFCKIEEISGFLSFVLDQVHEAKKQGKILSRIELAKDLAQELSEACPDGSFSFEEGEDLFGVPVITAERTQVVFS